MRGPRLGWALLLACVSAQIPRQCQIWHLVHTRPPAIPPCPFILGQQAGDATAYFQTEVHVVSTDALDLESPRLAAEDNSSTRTREKSNSNSNSNSTSRTVEKDRESPEVTVAERTSISIPEIAERSSTPETRSEARARAPGLTVAALENGSSSVQVTAMKNSSNEAGNHSSGEAHGINRQAHEKANGSVADSLAVAQGHANVHPGAAATKSGPTKSPAARLARNQVGRFGPDKQHGSQARDLPPRRGRKNMRKISLGVNPKLDRWGGVGSERRTKYYFPLACLGFTGTIFIIMHLHRLPWQPPKGLMKPAILAPPSRQGSRSAVRGSSKLSIETHRATDSHIALAVSTAVLNKEEPEEEAPRGADTQEASAEESKQVLRRRKTEYGFVDKMFLKHWNRSFGENAQLTLRGALLALIAGLPLIVPETYIPGLQQFKKTGFWSVGAITLFIFTIWKTVGETLFYAWCGIFGTFMACLDIWIMFGIFPGGVSEVSPPIVFWAGVANGVLFIPAVLWLNVDDNTKIFALMNFVWYWMAFLDPDRADIFSERFSLTSGSAEVSAMLAAVSGGGLAVTATLLPFPLWALGKACQGSHEIVAKLGFVWNDSLDSYCSPSGHVFETDRLVRELTDLHEQMEEVQSHLRYSWWECFGLGAWQRTRLMTARLVTVMQDEFDSLYSVLNATLTTERTEEDLNVFMQLEERMRDLVSQAQWLLQCSASAACRGGFTVTEISVVKKGVEQMRQAINNLALEFRDLKQEQGGPKLTEELLDEHAFCYNLCCLGRIAINFTQDILRVTETGFTDHLPDIQESVGFWIVFDRQVLFNVSYVVYVIRTSLRILICFFLGYHGYSNVVRGKNAGIAVPATLLLMRYAGSAIQKNAKRLQAVVLGVVTGVLVHAIVGRCVWWGYLLTGVCYFSWLLLAFFIYFDAVEQSYSGLLMAYFGTVNMLRGCNEVSFDAALTHYPITNTVVAIFVVSILDALLHWGRAAVSAYEAYIDVWKAMTEAVKAMFDPNIQHVEFSRSKIMALVLAAQALGEEARVEPRWWRIPWPVQTYTKAIQCSYQLCGILSNMERTVAVSGRDRAQRHEVFESLLQVRGFQELVSVLLAKMKQMEKLLRVFLHDTSWQLAELDAPSMLVGYLRDEAEARKKFMDEVAKLDEVSCQEAGEVGVALQRQLSYARQVDSLELDPASQVSILLSDVEQMIRTMRILHHAILRN